MGKTTRSGRRTPLYDPKVVDPDHEQTIQAAATRLGLQDQPEAPKYGEDPPQKSANTRPDNIYDRRLHGFDDDRNKGGRRCLLVCLLFSCIFFITGIALLVSTVTSPSGYGPVSLEEPPDNLSEICNSTNLKKSEDSYIECAEHCERAECCDYPSSLDLSCLIGNEEKCMAYHQGCGTLMTPAKQELSVPSTPDEAPSGLADACSSDNLQSHTGIRICAKMCRDAECCWAQGIDSCSDALECQGYQPCLNLQSVHKDEAREEDEDAAIPDVDTAAVDKACSPEQLGTEQGYADCNNMCSAARCCWDDSAEKHCLSLSVCSKYKNCYHLKALKQVNPAITETVSEACSRRRVGSSEWQTWCDTACNLHRCCFDDTVGPCPFNNHDTICSQYMSCANLNLALRSSEKPKVPSLELVDKCFAAGKTAECESKCNEASCCKLQESDSESCLPGNRKLCMYYNKACSGLDWGKVQHDGITIEAPSQDLRVSCSSDALATTAGYDACTDQCTPANCCFEMLVEVGEKACSLNDRCSSYAPCLTINALLKHRERR